MKGISRTLKRGSHTLVILLCLALAVVQQAFAAPDGQSSGTATVSSVGPSISSPELWDSEETTNKNNTALAVNTEYHVNFTVSDSNSLADLNNCTIITWDSSATTETGADAQTNHYTFTWVESTDTWSCSGPGSSYIVTANCKDPGSGSTETSFEFTLAFKLSRVAGYNATTTVWKIKIYAYDDAGSSDFEQSLMFGVAFYSEVSITDTTHTWSNLQPGDTGRTVDGDGDIDFTAIANDDWRIQAKGSGDLTSGSNTIALSNLKIHEDTQASAVSLTTTYTDVGGLINQSPPTDENSPTAAFVTLWLDVPSGTPPGDYTYTLYIQVLQQP